jgi:putative heme-binding domain-containing protein
MAESPKTAALLGKAFANRDVSREELPIVLEALRKHGGKDDRKLLAAIEEDASTGSSALNPAEIRERIAEGANPWAGLGIFFQGSSRCSTCHSVAGRGSSLGPPLTLTSSSPPVENLIASILWPSKTIKARYESARYKLRDGRTLVGIVSARDDKSLKLKEANGREVRIGREMIDFEAGEPNSLMPAHIALDLTPDELVDLVSFLRSKPVQDSLKHGPRKLDRVVAIGPFPLGADRSRVPLDRIEQTRSYAGQDGAGVSWIALEATPAGLLNLRGEMASKPGRAYLAAEVRSTLDQSAALRFAIEGAARVYLNGSRVADVPEHDAATLTPAFSKTSNNALPPLPDLARLNLKTGWNLLLVAIDRLDDTSGDVRAMIEIAAPEPVEVRTPQSRGD